jgi:uncharacterized protein (TIGR02391 family)
MPKKPEQRSRPQRQKDIETESVLAQVQIKAHEWIRLSRVRYWKSRHQFLDVRSFFRGTDHEDGSDVLYPTNRGIQVPEQVYLELLSGIDAVPPWLLHPSLPPKCVKAFSTGDYERVQFEALRAVEVAVRRVGKLPNNLVGIQLMRRAFDPKDGPLADPEAEFAEREAMAHLFAGAIGVFKNPASHRETTPAREEAARTLVFASHLLAVVDERESLAGPT